MKLSALAERSVQVWHSGLRGAILRRCDRLWLTALRRIFDFDAWHVGASYARRPYKRAIVELATAIAPTSVVEVGCGLGDIVSRVPAAERYGIDADPGVIRAARFLHPRKARWIHGNAAGVAAILGPQRQIDCMIMVNWIHNLSPQELADVLAPLLPRLGFLIVDAIDSDGPASYRYKHDFKFLSGAAVRMSQTRVAGEPRSFLVFKVLK